MRYVGFGTHVPRSSRSGSSRAADLQAFERSLLDPIPVRRRSLPEPGPPLVGRQQELDGLRQRLRRRRLVSIVGTGGVGKTRLAIAFAAEHPPDDMTFVDLASIRIGAMCGAATAALRWAPRSTPLEPTLIV